MKKIILQLLILLLCNTAKAENTYIPMLAQGNQWNEVAISGYESEYKKTSINKLVGDTVINEITYLKLLTAKDEYSSTWEISGFLREDIENKKVYFKQGDYMEVLIYDFDVNVGDIIESYYSAAWIPSSKKVCHEILAVDEIMIDNVSHKKIEVVSYSCDQDSHRGFPDHYWIEGVGGSEGLLNSSGRVVTGVAYLLLCFFQNDELAYKPNPSEDCFIWEDPTSYLENIFKENLDFRVTDKTLHTQYPHNYDIEIFDTFGKLIDAKFDCLGQIKIDLSQISLFCFSVVG